MIPRLFVCEPRLIAIRAFEDFAWRRAYNRSERNGRRKVAKNSAQIAKKAPIAIRRSARCLVHTTIATDVGKLLTTLVAHDRPPMRNASACTMAKGGADTWGITSGQPWPCRYFTDSWSLPPRCDQAASACRSSRAVALEDWTTKLLDGGGDRVSGTPSIPPKAHHS